MARDTLFSEQPPFTDFNFGEATAAVFDDMLNRSVPLYGELQRMITELAADHAQPGSHVYDLGCSTGTTLRYLHHALPAAVSLVGLDSSEAMLAKAKENLTELLHQNRLQLRNADFNEPLQLTNASVVIMNLTLQFVHPEKRLPLMRDIFAGLNPGGCLILVEKVLGNDEGFNQAFIRHYYDMKKRHGYSEMEIARKRDTLENVLIPYRVEDNLQLLREAGFARMDIFFKWYNFCGFVAIK
jgi:tRNA (cmo5U34)-methyltransferase